MRLILSLLACLGVVAPAVAAATAETGTPPAADAPPPPPPGAPAPRGAGLDLPSRGAPPAIAIAADGSVSAESLAVRHLREVVAREQAVWARVAESPDDAEVRKRAETDLRDLLTAYANVVREGPDIAEAWAAYGLFLGRTGNREEAAMALARANKLNPNIAVVKNQLGNYLFENGDYQAALPYYLAAIELEPSEPRYHYNLGSLLHEYRRFFLADEILTGPVLDAKMQAAFRRAAELAPASWAYGYRYAESFYDLETPDWAGALREWEALEQKAPPAGPEVQTVRLQRANVLLKLGRRDEARALLETVTEPMLQENKRTLVEQLGETPKE